VTEFRRVPLSTGVELNVGIAGPQDGQPVILLHGFPESHRTWREIAPRLEHRFRLIMPDLRGFGASDRPSATKAYGAQAGADDLIALAKALRIERFSLVGHDIGGVVAWTAAQAHADRIERLAILNAPHPYVFQKSLIEDLDQRKASQYINAFKLPGADRLITADLDRFFDQAIGANVANTRILEADRQQYLAEWSQPGAMKAMLQWYRAAKLLVPPPLLTVPLPDALLRLAPKIRIPTLVIWGMQDQALLAVQLEGLDRVVEQLAIVRLPEAGHFVPWEAPDAAAQALEAFLSSEPSATAPAT
jgi:pimeloyl-ACP methyl ester carboxylesterase